MNDGIYFYKCPECDKFGREGWHALHVKNCINPECKAENEFYRPNLKINDTKWTQCKHEICPDLFPAAKISKEKTVPPLA
jgi:acetone carboxylase gamma subunit